MTFLIVECCRGSISKPFCVTSGADIGTVKTQDSLTFSTATLSNYHHLTVLTTLSQDTRLFYDAPENTRGITFSSRLTNLTVSYLGAI